MKRSIALRIWCEGGKCQVGRVFGRRDGHLVEMAGTTLWGVDDQGPIRTKNSCFWMEETASDELALGLSISCQCKGSESHWKLTYGDISRALANGSKNLGVSAR